MRLNSHSFFLHSLSGSNVRFRLSLLNAFLGVPVEKASTNKDVSVDAFVLLLVTYSLVLLYLSPKLLLIGTNSFYRKAVDFYAQYIYIFLYAISVSTLYMYYISHAAPPLFFY